MQMKIIDPTLYTPLPFSAGSLGGRKVLLKPGKEGGAWYIVKYEQQWQSLNEVIVQGVLQEIGLETVPTALVNLPLVYGDKGHRVFYGALALIEGLHRIPKDCKGLTAIQKTAYIQHRVIACLLDNPDGGEQYLTSSGAVLSLDHGECLLTESICELYMAGKWGNEEKSRIFTQEAECLLQSGCETLDAAYMRKTFESIVDSVKKEIGMTEEFCEDHIALAAMQALRNLAQLDMGRMEDCFMCIRQCYSEKIAEAYRAWLYATKRACEGALQMLRIKEGNDRL